MHRSLFLSFVLIGNVLATAVPENKPANAINKRDITVPEHSTGNCDNLIELRQLDCENTCDEDGNCGCYTRCHNGYEQKCGLRCDKNLECQQVDTRNGPVCCDGKVPRTIHRGRWDRAICVGVSSSLQE